MTRIRTPSDGSPDSTMPTKRTNSLKFVVAGDSRNAIEEACGSAAWRSLADNGFVERTSVSCVGFHRDIDANTLLIVLPKAFSSPEARARLNDPGYERELIYQLIRIFKKVRRDTRFSVHGGTTNRLLDRERTRTDPVLDSFDAALRLGRDYRENGLYVRKSAKQLRNKQNLPINWPRTIQNSTTILNGQDICFDDTVHNARKHNLTHPLCQLHIACLREIFSLTGERSDLEDLHALDGRTFHKIRKNSRRYLRSLKGSIFDERGRFLVAAISSFLGESGLLNTSQEEQEELLSYSKDFEDIWEKVLRDLMAPNFTNRTLPAGRWHTWPNSTAIKGMQPELDIRLSSKDTDILVDAKDYRLLNGAKWKGATNDHYKQIIYRKLFAAPRPGTVINILAFPALGQRNLFEIRGCHDWTEVAESRVFEVTVDYDLAIKRWLREISLDMETELSNLLASLGNFNDELQHKMENSEHD
jgi:hypothetical protein